jgi:hypothetical protein
MKSLLANYAQWPLSLENIHKKVMSFAAIQKEQ